MKALQPIMGAFVAVAVGFGSPSAKANPTQDSAQLCAVFLHVQPQISLLMGLAAGAGASGLESVEKKAIQHDVLKRTVDFLMTFNAAAVEYLKGGARTVQRQPLSGINYVNLQASRVLDALIANPRNCPVDAPLLGAERNIRIAPPFIAAEKSSVPRARLSVLQSSTLG